MTFKRVRAGIYAATTMTLVTACASPQTQVQHREDMLAAAGFEVHPADTEKRKELLHKLPSHQFVMRDVGGRYLYMYSDPLVCGCLYVGTQHAYDAYKREMFQEHLADEQQMTAQLYSDPAWSFGMWGGPWGPGFGPNFGGPGF